MLLYVWIMVSTFQLVGIKTLKWRDKKSCTNIYSHRGVSSLCEYILVQQIPSYSRCVTTPTKSIDAIQYHRKKKLSTAFWYFTCTINQNAINQTNLNIKIKNHCYNNRHLCLVLRIIARQMTNLSKIILVQYNDNNFNCYYYIIT